tara:strand:- start:314 stop:529 length:216 start_codon:yes stop_codon:yes gene_type:complete
MELKDNLYATDRLILNTILKRIEQEDTTYENEKKRIRKGIKNNADRNKINACFERLDNHVKSTKNNIDAIQ